MAFDNITTAELSVGKPITNELLEKFKNRDDFLNGAVGTISGLGILNPSFEVDSDGDGQPDNWTPTFFTGGTGAIDTSTSVHGAVSYKFTHPGGAGNGGGQIESDFYPVSSNYGYMIEYAYNKKGASVPKAEIIKYDRNQSVLSTYVLLNSTVGTGGATGTFHRYSAGFLAAPTTDHSSVNSSVTYIKLRLTGGTTDHSSAGSYNFDDILVTPIGLSSPGEFVVLELSNLIASSAATTSYQAAGLTTQFSKPGGYRLSFTGIGTTEALAGSHVQYLVNGTVLGETTVNASTVGTTYSVDFPTDFRRRFNVGDIFTCKVKTPNVNFPWTMQAIRLKSNSGIAGAARTTG